MIVRIPVTFSVSGMPDHKITIKSFSDYAKLYYKTHMKNAIKFETQDSEVVIMPSQNDENQTIGFVNGISCCSGVHVDEWTDCILKSVLEKLNVKKSTQQLTIRDIRPYFNIFVNCTLTNPRFTSQEKTKLSLPKPKSPSIEAKFVNAILKWDVIENIKSLQTTKEMLLLKKSEKGRGYKKIEGYDAANKLGKDSILILCEGLSARSFSVVGINTGAYGKKGREHFGIMALRGKILNTRNSTSQVISKNNEITHIIQAVGLRFGVDYTLDEHFNQLNYGRIITNFDADLDGSHIYGLFVNFIHSLFPSLLHRKESFIVCMKTPIMRIYPKTTKKNEGEPLSFYTLKEYDAYTSKNKIQGDIRYVKGLGGNSDKEIKECFGKRMAELVMDVKADESIDKAFSNKKADLRKGWLEDFTKQEQRSYEEYTQKVQKANGTLIDSLTVTDFMNNEFILYSLEDCKRSLVSLMDGLKESQRKILFSCFVKKLNYNTKELKVAQLSSFTAEVTEYKYGEGNLCDTIVKLAQNYVGSNNCNYLAPIGQHGTRNSNGDDASSPRYIYTKLSKITRLIFREEDDTLLDYIEEEGRMIEPKTYIPIIPCIFNGACGIGSGYSVNIPNFNPYDIIQFVKKWMETDHLDEISLSPWYNGFKGKIERVDNNKYISYGILKRLTDKKVVIEEIPIGMSIDKMKDKIEDLLEEKKIKSFKNFSSTTSVHFEITEKSEEDSFKCTLESIGLKSNISLSNMVMFDINGKIKKYTLQDIFNEFCSARLSFYTKRKQNLKVIYSKSINILSNKKKFIEDVMHDVLLVKGRDESDIVKDMVKAGYTYSQDKNFNYLLDMNIRSFTTQKLTELNNAFKTETSRLQRLEATSEKEMWNEELKELELELGSKKEI
jgi:DNA topoisomerase-2